MPLKVDDQQLNDLGNQLAQGSTQIEDQLAALRARVAPLVAGDWEGAASQSFQNAWDEWARSAASLKQALDSISTTLVQAAHLYGQTETDIGNSFRPR